MNLDEPSFVRRAARVQFWPCDGFCPTPFIMDTPTPCKHTQVRVVAREDDIEFVECQFCGEVFDANEFNDMEIEEKALSKTDEDE